MGRGGAGGDVGGVSRVPCRGRRRGRRSTRSSPRTSCAFHSTRHELCRPPVTRRHEANVKLNSSVARTNPFCICTEYFATGDTRLPLALEDWGRDDCIRVLTSNFSPRLPFASRPILTTPRRLSPRLLIGRSAAVVVVDAHRGLQYGSRDDSDDSGRRDRGARRERASAVGG